MQDEQILELFFARAENAIETLAEQYGPVCYKTAYNILQNREDVQECVNDAYLGFWEAKELTAAIQAFLDTQTAQNRLLFVRRYWYLDSFSNLARYTGLRENAIRTRLARQKRELKEFLAKRGVFV